LSLSSSSFGSSTDGSVGEQEKEEGEAQGRR
jgi:hypothetical protein